MVLSILIKCDIISGKTMQINKAEKREKYAGKRQNY